MRTSLRSLLTMTIVAPVVLLGACQSDIPNAPVGQTAAPSAAADAVVRRLDFAIVYKVAGVTSDSARVGVDVRPGLSFVPAPNLVTGSPVDSGAPLGSAVLAQAARDQLEREAASSRMGQSMLAHLTGFEGPVVAPVSGLLDISGPRPMVVDSGIDVVAELTPLQGLRFQSLRFSGEAQVETVVGGRRVSCTSIWVSDGQDDVATDPSAAPAAQSSAHCRLPSWVETVAGLRADLTMTSQTIKDALVVPNLYLRYDAVADGYTVVGRAPGEGTWTTYPVSVGPSDGVVRVVTGDIPEGTELQRP